MMPQNPTLDELVARTRLARTLPADAPRAQAEPAAGCGVHARRGSTTVVAVDGPSGAGKSTLAGRLAAALSTAGVTTGVVHMDELFPGWTGLDEGLPNLLRWVLEPLSRNETARYRRFDWSAGRFAEWITVPTTQVLIVEGVSSGSSVVAPYLGLLMWIEAPRTVRFDRGIERDGEAYRPMWERWALQEERLFGREHTRDRADVILDGTSPIR